MVQEGRFRGGVAPYGYDLIPSGVLNKKKREVMKLKINESEAKVIRMIFNFCVEKGYGRCKIANLLTSMGIYTREGKAWHEATIGHILHSHIIRCVSRTSDHLGRSIRDGSEAYG